MVAIGVEDQHPGAMRKRQPIDPVLPLQLHQLALHQRSRLRIVDKGLVHQLQVAPLLVTHLLGDTGEVSRGEVEMKEAKLFAHQPLGSVVIRHDAHLAGAAVATRPIRSLGLLASLQIDAQGVVARLVIAGLVIAVAPTGDAKPGFEPAGVLQPGAGADQCIKYPCCFHSPLPPVPVMCTGYPAAIHLTDRACR